MPLVKPFDDPFDTTGVIFSDDVESFDDDVEYFWAVISDNGIVVGLDESGRCGDDAGDCAFDVITFDIVIADWVWMGRNDWIFSIFN